jgi:hypothetical protein
MLMKNKIYTEQEIESKRKLSLALYIVMFVLIIIVMFAMFLLNLKIGYVTILALGITGCFAGATILKLHIQTHLSELLISKISSSMPAISLSALRIRAAEAPKRELVLPVIILPFGNSSAPAGAPVSSAFLSEASITGRSATVISA